MDAPDENMSSSSGGTTASIETTLPTSPPAPHFTTTTNINIDGPPTEDPPPPPSPGPHGGGIDNPGFVEEDGGGAAFLNSPSPAPAVDTGMLKEADAPHGGDATPASADKAVAEAVNLELVNMNPYKDGTNGIPIKKENGEEGVSGNYQDPYDEYFVPVNEHRKYMRGEKLYVTKDKRRTQSWRKCICWSIGFVVLAIIIVIGILAGTRVILSQEESPVIESASSRHFGNDIKTAGFGNRPAVTSTREPTPTTPPPPGITTPDGPPTTDMTQIYVPRVVEGEMVIDSMAFSPTLLDHNSTEFKALAASLEEELKNALFDHSTLNYGAADIFVKVIDFSPGSVVTKFRVGWVFKEGIRNPPNPIDKDQLRERLERHLARYAGYLHTYHLTMGSTRTSNVMDQCKFNNGACSHECVFDYSSRLNFMCKCPEDLVLDPAGTKCVDKSSAAASGHAHPEPEPEATPEPSSEPEPSSSPEPEPHAHPEPSSEPEPTSEPEPSPEPEPTSQPGLNASTASKPSAHPEPSSEPEPTSEPEPSASPEPSPEPGADSQPKTEAPSAEPEPTTHKLPADTHVEHEMVHIHHHHHHEHMEKTSEFAMEHGEMMTTLPPDMSKEEERHEHEHHHVVGVLDSEHSTEQAVQDMSSTEEDNVAPRFGGMTTEKETVHSTEHHDSHEGHVHLHDVVNHRHDHTTDASTAGREDVGSSTAGHEMTHEHSVVAVVPGGSSEDNTTTMHPMADDHSSTEVMHSSEEASTSRETPQGTLRAHGDDPRLDHESTDNPFISMDGDFWDQFHQNVHPSEKMKMKNDTDDMMHNVTISDPRHPESKLEMVENMKDETKGMGSTLRSNMEHSEMSEITTLRTEMGNSEEMTEDLSNDDIFDHPRDEKKPKHKLKYDEPKSVLPLPYEKANKTKNNSWFDDILSESENDTSLNALSPEDYDNHDHTFTAPKNESNSKLPSFKKRPRLDKDEMHVSNPSEEKNSQFTTEKYFETIPHIHLHMSHDDAENATREGDSNNKEPNNIWGEPETQNSSSHHEFESSNMHNNATTDNHFAVHDQFNSIHDHHTTIGSNDTESSRMFSGDETPIEVAVTRPLASNHSDESDGSILINPVIDSQTSTENMHMSANDSDSPRMLSEMEMTTVIMEAKDVSTFKRVTDLPPVTTTLFANDPESHSTDTMLSMSESGKKDEVGSASSTEENMKMVEGTTLTSREQLSFVNHVEPADDTKTENKSMEVMDEMSDSDKEALSESTTENFNEDGINKNGARHFDTSHVSLNDSEISTSAMGEPVTLPTMHGGMANTSESEPETNTDVIHMTVKPESSVTDSPIFKTDKSEENANESDNKKNTTLVSPDDDNRLVNDLHAFVTIAESNMTGEGENTTEMMDKKIEGMMGTEKNKTEEITKIEMDSDMDNNNVKNITSIIIGTNESKAKEESKADESEILNLTTTESAPKAMSPKEQENTGHGLEILHAVSTESVIFISDADKKDATTKTVHHNDNVFGDSLSNDYTEEDVENKLLYSTGFGVDKSTSSGSTVTSTQSVSMPSISESTTQLLPETTHSDADSHSTSTEVLYSKEFNKAHPHEKDISVVPLKQDSKKNNKKLVKFNEGSQETEVNPYDKKSGEKPSKFDKDSPHKMDRLGLAAPNDKIDDDSDPYNMFDDYESLDLNKDTESPTKMATTTADPNEHEIETVLPTHFVPTALPEETSSKHAMTMEKDGGEAGSTTLSPMAVESEHIGTLGVENTTISENNKSVDAVAQPQDHLKSVETTSESTTEKLQEIVKPLAAGLEPAFRKKPQEQLTTTEPSESVSKKAEDGVAATNLTAEEGEILTSSPSGGIFGTKSPIFEISTSNNNVTQEDDILHPNTVFFSKCAAGQFQCLNGTARDGSYCVSVSTKCDSINDCSDGSDELGCIEQNCPGNFQCTSGQCLKRHLVCNGIVDCNDGSDEVACEKWHCEFDEFQCPSGRCIPVVWQCDGKPDCLNHTDEYNCQTSCGNDEFLCPEGWCIPLTWRCNGVVECSTGEDEKLCECSVDQFKCHTGGCVAQHLACDGIDHCPDASDEWDCIRLRDDSTKLEIRSWKNEWLGMCQDGWSASWSDLACRSLGYSKSLFTEPKPYSGSAALHSLIPSAPTLVSGKVAPRLTAALTDNATCTSNNYVEVACLDFTCGTHSLPDGVAARLVGGSGATQGQWPSVALLYHTRHKLSCTASIISPKWLLGSYNCLHLRDKQLSPQNWVAFGGGSMFDTTKPDTQIREVRAIVPYPEVKYNQFLYNNDIALVELATPLSFTRFVGAVCLPDKEIEPRQLCVTAGWGYTSPGQINFSQYLHYLPVPTIDLKECNSTKHYAGFITNEQICAGFTDAEKSPCYNDEGAPLMCVNEGGVWELHGVLSYHSNCGRGHHPSIFSSVTAVRAWVEKTVGSRFERKSNYNVR